jgi:hypothetical protein
MDQRPEQRPEGKLIGEAAARQNLSIRKAAERAGLSYGRWRQVVAGYQNVSPGSYAAVKAPARTLARMARAVGITAEQMANEGGRPDAAEFMLREVPPPQPAREDSPLSEDVDTETAIVLADIRSRIAMAAERDPGKRLEGSDVFPSPHDPRAKIWDSLQRLGFTMIPEGFSAEQLAASTAIEIVQRRIGGNAVNGLTRRA